jgi:hypothetical protein
MERSQRRSSRGELMAILTVAGLSLVAHSSGGAILTSGGSYLAGTFVGAPIVAAFTTAAGALAQMGAVAVGVASAPATVPVLVGAVTIAAVAAGAYCYLHGIPAPVVETLSAAGLGTTTAKGFMVPVAKLAPALILLGALGYLAYVAYKDFKAFKAEYNNQADFPPRPDAVTTEPHSVRDFAYRRDGKRRPLWLAWLLARIWKFFDGKRGRPSREPLRLT